MKRIASLLENARFKAAVAAIESKEADRIYCRHGLGHLLDTARIAYILTLERGEKFPKDIVYACALTHDIGRAYSDEGHAEASAVMCEDILEECGFSSAEIAEVRQAVASHRGGDGLAAILHEADGLSRQCRGCAAAQSCYWSDERKNKEIEY